MSQFPSKNTKLEVGLRKLIFSRGFRYRLHVHSLKGTPDLVFPKYKAVVFIHGCFWHHHENCSRSHLPQSNQRFWLDKFERNRKRDRKSELWLVEHGWRVLTVWECAIRTPKHFNLDELLDFIECWLIGDAQSCQISGMEPLPVLPLSISCCYRKIN